jgi:hypothetical protein
MGNVSYGEKKCLICSKPIKPNDLHTTPENYSIHRKCLKCKICKQTISEMEIQQKEYEIVKNNIYCLSE